MFPSDEPVIVKEWILPRWAYTDGEWDEFTIEEIRQGYRFVSQVNQVSSFHGSIEDDII